MVSEAEFGALLIFIDIFSKALFMIVVGVLIKRNKLSFQSLAALVGASVLISDIYASAALHYVFTTNYTFSAGSAGDFCLFIFIVPLVYRKWGFKEAKDLVIAIILVKVFGGLITATLFSAKISLSYASGPVAEEILQEIFGSLLNPTSSRVILSSLLCVIVDSYLILYFYNLMVMKVPIEESDSKIVKGLKEFAIFTIAAYLTLIFDSLIFVTGSFFDNPFFPGILKTHLVIKSYISAIFGVMFVLAIRIIPDDETDPLKE